MLLPAVTLRFRQFGLADIGLSDRQTILGKKSNNLPCKGHDSNKLAYRKNVVDLFVVLTRNELESFAERRNASKCMLIVLTSPINLEIGRLAVVL